MYNLPTEVLLEIFAYVPAKQLMRLREVCSRWKNIVDEMTRSDSLWRKYCQKDYLDVYKVACHNARVGMLWFHIYRSLSLWPRLTEAREIRDEFASASSLSDEIQGFEILKDGIIGVHKKYSIIYYDIETLEPAKRSPITGDYRRYTETDEFVIIHGHQLHLYVIRKMLHNIQFETNVTFDGVKFSMIVDKDLYYVDLGNNIHLCDLKDGNLSSKLLKHSEEAIICLGYSDHLNILTFQRKIYSLVQGNIVLACDLEESSNILHELYKYKFLENVDWRIIYEWMCILRRRVPEGPLQEIQTVRVYGDTVFVGCNWGVLRIYHKPFINGEFDFYHAEPVKQYNFMERSDCPVLSMSGILQVDILEAMSGHTVIVAMPKKIAVLEFTHSFKRTASVAVLPYSSERAKLIRCISPSFVE